MKLDGFFETLKTILYKRVDDRSNLIESIGHLCVPTRSNIGLKAIVSYNFDNLIEKKINELGLKYISVYDEGSHVDANSLWIYHAHGFLPQNEDVNEEMKDSLVVFSEDGYHKLMMEPYNWANLVQLNYLMNSTCLFVGLSMTDPNLRRLLDIAAQKEPEGVC